MKTDFASKKLLYTFFIFSILYFLSIIFGHAVIHDISSIWENFFYIGMLLISGFCLYAIILINKRTINTNTALSELEQRYEQLFHGANDAIFVAELTDNMEFSKMIEVNNVASERLGYSRDELLTMTPLDFMDADHMYKLEEFSNSITNTGYARMEAALTTKQGLPNPVDINSQMITLDGKKALLSIVRDITQQKLLERQLQEKEQRYRSLFEQNPDPILIMDLQGVIITSNIHAENVSGYEQSEFLQKSFVPFIAEEDLEQTLEHFSKVVAGHSQTYETSIIHKKGHRVHITVTNVLIYVDKQIVGIYAIFKDITETKKLKEFADGQNRILEKIARSNSLSDTLEEIIHVIERKTGNVCSILLTDKEEKRLFNGASPSLPMEYIQRVDGITIDPLVGACGSAASTKKAVFVEDIATDPLCEQFRDITLMGFHACYSMPIINENKLLGTFAMYFNETRKPKVSELETIEKICYLTTLAIERKQSEELIHHMAYYDHLTGLANRRLFKKYLDQAIDNANAHKGMLTLIYLDVDRFKLVNDSLGHFAGDQLLRSFSNRLLECVPDYALVSRNGGDEFAIILEQVTEDMTFLIANSIIAAFQEPYIIENREIFLTTSMGIGFFPNDGNDAISLIKCADRALNQAKRNGKNNYQLYKPDLLNGSDQWLVMESYLRRVLDKNELVLYYQPQIELSTKKMTGVEALLRWNHPHLGLVAPSSFIPLAEETGLILSIGEWSLRNACRQNKAWQDAGYDPITISVNLSAKQFDHPSLADMVSTILNETGLDPQYLELEITESMTMDYVSLDTLNQLKKLGVKITIDDFGTGYSSLHYLKNMPITRLKIDQSFVKDITLESNDKSIVTTIISLAHNLKMKVIAEGVETDEQLRFLQERKCDHVQGFLFDKPMPAEELMKGNYFTKMIR